MWGDARSVTDLKCQQAGGWGGEASSATGKESQQTGGLGGAAFSATWMERDPPRKFELQMCECHKTINIFTALWNQRNEKI